MSSAAKAQSASHVDPTSIESRTSIGGGAELLVRHRPPGSVDLAHGQREHMLMCSVGSPVRGSAVRSVLRTANGCREWTSCPQGHVTFVPSGFPMKWDWSYESESVHLTMLPSFLEELVAGFDGHDGERPQLKPLFRVLDHGMNSLLHQLRDEAAGDRLGKSLVTSSLLQLIATRIYRIGNSTPSSTGVNRDPVGFSASACRRSIEILSDRLDENISLSELASEFNLSPFHFARVFKRATGFPPHEYQLQLRITRARELLCRQPGKSIADIACELGFADESHFRRHFRRIVGTTPGQFRTQQ